MHKDTFTKRCALKTIPVYILEKVMRIWEYSSAAQQIHAREKQLCSRVLGVQYYLYEERIAKSNSEHSKADREYR